MRLHLARDLRLAAPGGKVHPLSPLDAALLTWLALEGPTPRARLAQLLWPDKSAEAARNSLRQRLFQLHRRLGHEVVGGNTALALAEGVAHDLDDADCVLGQTPGEDLASGEFAQWLEAQRARRRARVRRAIVEQCDRAESAGHWDEALIHARELLAHDPLSEDAHRRVMRLHYLAGDRAAALLAFDRCERLLKDEVGTRPSPPTLALLEQIGADRPAVHPTAPAAIPASVLRPPQLVGREREGVALQHALRAGQVAALIGEAGLGKTRLLQEVIGSQPGTVAAAGRPGDSGVPFATLARLLRTVVQQGTSPEPATLPAQSRTEIARVLPEFDVATARPAGDGQRLVLVRAIRALLQAHPQFDTLVVDDLHFADEASVEMLGQLIDGGDDASTAQWRWVLAYRPTEAGSSVQTLHDRLVEAARLAPLTLGPLDEPALVQLVDSLALPGVDGRVLAPGLLRRTGGNPLFVLETLKQAWVEQTLARLADADALPRPLSVGRLIERRITQLSPGAVALARVASIAGVDFSVALAEHVLQQSAMQFADALNELEAAQVLRGTQFAHDLVFETVRDSVPEAIGRHTHAQVAQWLEDRAADPARVARHWRAAARDDRARPALDAAAQAALRAGRSKEAIGFYQEAVAIDLARGARPTAFVALQRVCELHYDRREFEAGTSAAKRLAALAGDEPERRAALRLLAWGAFHCDQLADAERLGRELLATVPSDSFEAAQAHELLGLVASGLERFGEAVVHMRSALPGLREWGGARSYMDMLNHLGLVLDQQGRTAEACEPFERLLEVARSNADPSLLSVALRNAAINRVHAGDAATAFAWFTESLQLENAADAMDSGAGYSHTLLIVTSCDNGRWDAALRHADAALAQFEANDLGWLGPTRTSRAGMWLHMGQWARALQELDAPVSERVPAHSRARRLMLRARALSALGEPVLSLLDEALALSPTSGRIDARLLVLLERMRHVDDAEVLRLAQDIGREACQRGMQGFELWALLRSMEAAARHDGDSLPARVQRMNALAGRAHCYSMSPAEVWVARVQAAIAMHDDPLAQRLSAEGVRWLQGALVHVPPEFRDTFAQRHPLHVELLSLARRLTS